MTHSFLHVRLQKKRTQKLTIKAIITLSEFIPAGHLEHKMSYCSNHSVIGGSTYVPLGQGSNLSLSSVLVRANPARPKVHRKRDDFDCVDEMSM